MTTTKSKPSPRRANTVLPMAVRLAMAAAAAPSLTSEAVAASMRPSRAPSPAPGIAHVEGPVWTPRVEWARRRNRCNGRRRSR